MGRRHRGTERHNSSWQRWVERRGGGEDGKVASETKRYTHTHTHTHTHTQYDKHTHTHNHLIPPLPSFLPPSPPPVLAAALHPPGGPSLHPLLAGQQHQQLWGDNTGLTRGGGVGKHRSSADGGYFGGRKEGKEGGREGGSEGKTTNGHLCPVQPPAQADFSFTFLPSHVRAGGTIPEGDARLRSDRCTRCCPDQHGVAASRPVHCHRNWLQSAQGMSVQERRKDTQRGWAL